MGPAGWPSAGGPGRAPPPPFPTASRPTVTSPRQPPPPPPRGEARARARPRAGASPEPLRAPPRKRAAGKASSRSSSSPGNDLLMAAASQLAPSAAAATSTFRSRSANGVRRPSGRHPAPRAPRRPLVAAPSLAARRLRPSSRPGRRTWLPLEGAEASRDRLSASSSGSASRRESACAEVGARRGSFPGRSGVQGARAAFALVFVPRAPGLELLCPVVGASRGSAAGTSSQLCGGGEGRRRRETHSKGRLQKAQSKARH